MEPKKLMRLLRAALSSDRDNYGQRRTQGRTGGSHGPPNPEKKKYLAGKKKKKIYIGPPIEKEEGWSPISNSSSLPDYGDVWEVSKTLWVKTCEGVTLLRGIFNDLTRQQTQLHPFESLSAGFAAQEEQKSFCAIRRIWLS